MTLLSLFLSSFIIGIAIAAPVGPIGILCIQRSLHEGFKIGLMTGFGAALADGVYGLIAGFGLTAISSLLIDYQFWIRSGGGLFLLYLGGKLLITPYREKIATGRKERSALHALTTTFFLTLTNPMTILSFVAIFAGLGLGSNDQHFNSAIVLVIGVILGSASWWLLLSGGIALVIQRRLTANTMHWINRFSGIIMIAFGLFALLSK